MKVFVYGTLKPKEANYQSYCAGKVIKAIAGYTKGKLYSLPMGYPAMSEGNSKTIGVLLTFANADILTSLDILEGYQEHRASELNEYYRQLVPIYSLEDQLLSTAWSYFMQESRIERYGGVLVDSGVWTGNQR